MVISDLLHVTEMLDMTEKLDGFAQRLKEKLLDAFLTKKHLQALAR